MKIKCVLFFLLLQLSFSLSAQSHTSTTNRARKMEIGMNGGLHKSGFYEARTTYPFGKYKSFWSYNASVHYKIQTVKRLYAGFELEQMHVKSNLYFSKPYGFRTGYQYDALLDLDYINLHLLFGCKLFSIKKATISGTLSPYVGYLLRSQAKGRETISSTYEAYSDSLGIHNVYKINEQLINESQTKKLRKANIGWCLNLDVAVPLKERFAVVCRAFYNIGMYAVVVEDPYIGVQGYAFSVGASYKLN